MHPNEPQKGFSTGSFLVQSKFVALMKEKWSAYCVNIDDIVCITQPVLAG